MSKKPKPATAGEKIEMKRFGLTLAEVRNSGHRDDARRTDAALRRERMKERERCIACLQHGGWDVPLTLMDGSNP